MEPEIFSSADADDAQEAFQRWQSENPAGFYINQKAVSHGMLHKVGCGHVEHPGDWDPEFGDVARRAKVCHLDRAALLLWAEQQDLIVTFCADCRP